MKHTDSPGSDAGRGLKHFFSLYWKGQYSIRPAAMRGVDGNTDWFGPRVFALIALVMRSRIEPIKKVAKTLRRHRELILNYFRAKKQFSSGAVEGLTNMVKVTMRKSYGFRTFRITDSPGITYLANFLSHNSPADFADEAFF